MTARIPERMRHLPRDERGYPVPFIVLRDTTGRAHFTVNDEALRLRCFAEDLCGICGTKLFRGRWFIGGPLSAMDPNGVFVDPPMHAECARFSLQACPYLAGERWRGTVAGKSFPAEERDKMQAALVEYTMLPGRPDLFLAIMATEQRLTGHGMQTWIRPKRPYRCVEYWRHGQRLAVHLGKAMTRAALEARVRELSEGRP